MTPKEQTIYNYVEKHAGCNRRDVVAFIGIGWRNTYSYIRAMLDSGLLVLRETHKLYAVKQDT